MGNIDGTEIREQTEITNKRLIEIPDSDKNYQQWREVCREG